MIQAIKTLFVSSAVTLASLSAFSFNIFGKDDRVVVETPTEALQKIGRLRTMKLNQPFLCTASLVGPDIILTNNHCVAEFTNANISGRSKFHAFYKSGKALAVADVTAIMGRDTTKDWAILKLGSPIGKNLGWFGIAWETKDNRMFGGQHSSMPKNLFVTVAGYSGDVLKGEVMSIHEHCRILRLDPYETPGMNIYHDCDLTGGSSGSPFFRKAKLGHYEIVALNKAQLMGSRANRNSSSPQLHFDSYSWIVSNVGTDSRAFYDAVQSALNESRRRNSL